MAGRLYRMAKVVSANPSSWGIVDAKEISGFRRVSKLTDLYSIAECILSSAYGDGTTNGEDAVGQIWYVAEPGVNGDYKLTDWDNRKNASGWTRLNYGGNVSVPVTDVKVDGTTVLSNGIANITGISALNSKTSSLEQDLNNTKKVLSLVTTSIGVKKGEDVGDNRVSLGIATLDTNGNVPLSQLGNLDMTVFKVVNALPTTNIENKIYLLRATNVGDKNNYAEYVYTGNRTDAYDATKWEKLGEIAAEVNLDGYMTANDVRNAIQSTQSSIQNDYNGKLDKKVNKTDADNTYATITDVQSLTTRVNNIKQFNPTIPSNLPIASSIVLYDQNTSNANYLDGVLVMSDGKNSVIVADQFEGKATKAIADENGKNIDATYAKKADFEAISNEELEGILNN